MHVVCPTRLISFVQPEAIIHERPGSLRSHRYHQHSASLASHGTRVLPEPLLSRVAAQDPIAVRECVDRYAGLVWSLARRLLPAADLDDAVQEVFVEIWRSAPRFDPSIASETAFVAMLARRRLIDRRRSLDRRHDRAQLPDSLSDSAAPAQHLTEIADEAAVASQAMDTLSAEQRRCLRLNVYEGLSHENIAASTGIPLGTVKTHVRRGLIKIRELLAPKPKQPGGPAPRIQEVNS